MKPTLRQLRFIEEYAKCGVGAEAARRAGYANEKQVSRIMKSKAVAPKLAEMRETALKNAQCSLESLLVELEEARQLAIKNKASATAINASLAKAKLLGLDKPVKSEDGEEFMPVLVEFV